MQPQGPTESPTPPRVPPVEHPGPYLEEVLAKTVLRDGRPLNVFLTVGHNPAFLKRLNVLGGYFLAKNTLPLRDRELIVLRMGWLCQSSYEFGHHVEVAREAGLSTEEILACTLAPEEGCLQEQDRLLLRMADELFHERNLSDATWAAALERWSLEQAIDSVALAGFFWMMSTMLNTFGVQPEAGVPGFPS